ncbi:MAG: flagellar biosynthetic protein FliO [Akkermansiaceae bacterium]|nr:flagellar biosynthetic protein FliO [Verrucomicrobiales bacterium]
MNALCSHLRWIFLLALLLAGFAADASDTTNLVAGSTNTSHGSNETYATYTSPTPAAAATNQASPLVNDALPNPLASLGRVMLMLAVVLALFLAGVWLFRNWQRLTIHRGQVPKLNILETRALGGRQAIYVVGYANERFLIASSPAGINMLTHLQPGEETPATEPLTAPQPTFAATLAQMLKGK